MTQGSQPPRRRWNIKAARWSSILFLLLSSVWLHHSGVEHNSGTTTTTLPNRTEGSRQHQDNTSNNTFRILCTSTSQIVKRWPTGTWKIRCLDLQAWAQDCVASSGGGSNYGGNNIEIVAHETPDDANDRQKLEQKYQQRPFNATIQLKALIPYQDYMGDRVLVDLVDNSMLHSGKIPRRYHVIAQNEAQAAAYRNLHTTHVVEHPYTRCTVCQIQTELRRHFTKSDAMLALSIIRILPSERIGDSKLVEETVPNVSLISVDEDYNKMPYIYQKALQRRYRINNATSAQAMAQLIHNNTLEAGGLGYVYNRLYRYFDALVVYVKGGRFKWRFGSVQRIVNQMHSGVPVLVQALGIFETFVRKHQYACGFTVASTTSNDSDTKPAAYPNLTQLLARLRDDFGLRKKCQQQGLEISSHYSQSIIGRATLRAAGYQGEFHHRC